MVLNDGNTGIAYFENDTTLNATPGGQEDESNNEDSGDIGPDPLPSDDDGS